MVYPRNSSVRRRTETQARQIAKALSSSPYLRKRIRGIDACSNEIGCRPETFATDFRFLRSGIPCSNRHEFLPETENKVYLHATYHAGEDFIDIIDGLRAIDEAVQFLDLRRGDRLGHALALGLDPKSYYTLKEYKLIIPKQELLDNLVWILHRPLEYDLALPPKLRKRLERKALELMDEIGYDTSVYALLTYYHAWQLRGDHPSVYLSGGEDSSHIRDSGYESFYCMNQPSLDIYRKNSNVHTLCNLYHYDGDIKKRGKQVEAYPIEHGMEELIEALQNRMQHQLMEEGIAIECNPSSNVLIGSIEQYREHPMFRFNHHGLRVPRWETEAPANLSVSVNTDDQGVFDTSLESEYAYVARCLECERDEEGHRINSNDEIYACSIWRPVDVYRDISGYFLRQADMQKDFFWLCLWFTLIVMVMLIRYNHFAFLRYKYGFEIFLEKTNKPDEPPKEEVHGVTVTYRIPALLRYRNPKSIKNRRYAHPAAGSAGRQCVTNPRGSRYAIGSARPEPLSNLV